MKELDNPKSWLKLTTLFIAVGSVFTGYNSFSLANGLFEFFLASIGCAVLYSNYKDKDNSILFYILSSSVIIFSLAHPINKILDAKKIDRKELTEQPPKKPENTCRKFYNEDNKQVNVSEYSKCEKNYTDVKLHNYNEKKKAYDKRQAEADEHNASLKKSLIGFNLTYLEYVTIIFYIVIGLVYPACLKALVKQAAICKEQIEQAEKERLEKETIKPVKQLSKMKQGELVMMLNISDSEKKEKLKEIGLSRAQISKLKKALKGNIEETIQQSNGKIRKISGNKVETIGVKNGLAS